MVQHLQSLLRVLQLHHGESSRYEPISQTNIMSESDVNSERNRLGCVVDGPQSTMHALANSTLTNNTLLEESILSNDQTKKKNGKYIFEP